MSSPWKEKNLSPLRQIMHKMKMIKSLKKNLCEIMKKWGSRDENKWIRIEWMNKNNWIRVGSIN